jgi:hypothetical protein
LYSPWLATLDWGCRLHPLELWVALRYKRSMLATMNTDEFWWGFISGMCFAALIIVAVAIVLFVVKEATARTHR